MIIRGEKVLLSSDLDRKHADEIARLANDEEIYRKIGAHSYPFPYKKENALDFFNINRSIGNEVFMIDFLIFYGRRIAGVIGLSDINRTDMNAHIGYWVGKEFRNLGVATESVDLICNFARDDLKLVRLHTKVLEYNLASLRVLLKNGFKVEGYERKVFRFEGKYHDFFSVARIF